MTIFARRIRTSILLCALLISVQPLQASARASSGTPAVANSGESGAARNGQHDFDFHFGTWTTHILTLQATGSGPATWVKMTGTVIDRKIWQGRANLEEIEAAGAGAHFQGFTLFLYNPKSHQWSQSFASKGSGTLGQPMIGEFRNGQGELFGQESYQGRTVLARAIWSNITPDSYHYQEAYSADGGKTWHLYFIAQLTRQSQGVPEEAAQSKGSEQGGLHGFDFNIGAWRTNISALDRPLKDPKSWVKFEGTHIVHRIWNGWADFGQLEINGPTGHIEDLALRLYNPQSRQWTVYIASSRSGVLGPPVIGEFKNGRGVFIGQDQFIGKTVLVRNVWSDITANSCHNEWALSDDAGKTWTVYWIANDTRIE